MDLPTRSRIPPGSGHHGRVARRAERVAGNMKMELQLRSRGLRTLWADLDEMVSEDDGTYCGPGAHARAMDGYFDYPSEKMVVPANISNAQYWEMPIRGRELLHLLTSDDDWRSIRSDEALRLLRFSTRYECEVALCLHDDIEWEEVGSSRLSGDLPMERTTYWPVCLLDGQSYTHLAEMQYALHRVESRLLDWKAATTEDQTIFQDYAALPSAASHRVPYYPQRPTRCALLELPAEIRASIFDLSMPEIDERIVLFPPRSQEAAKLSSAGARYAQEPGVLHVNKQIRQETIAMFYHDREVYIPTMPFVGPEVTVTNALNHVASLLPHIGNCIIFQHFPLTSGHTGKSSPRSRTAMVAVHMKGNQFEIEVHHERPRLRLAAPGQSWTRSNENIECVTAGVENLVEAVQLAWPSHMVRLGEVKHFEIECDKQYRTNVFGSV